MFHKSVLGLVVNGFVIIVVGPPLFVGGARNFIELGQNKTMISFSDSRNRR